MTHYFRFFGFAARFFFGFATRFFGFGAGEAVDSKTKTWGWLGVFFFLVLGSESGEVEVSRIKMQSRYKSVSEGLL